MTKLERKVEATNRVNAIANELFPKYVQYAKQFIGKKIVKKDGSLTKEFKSGLPENPDVPGLRVWNESRTSYWEVTIDLCVSFGDYSDYFKVYSTIVDFEPGEFFTWSGIVKSVNDIQPRRTDYDAKTVIDAREEIKRLEEVISEQKRLIYPFDMRD